MLLMHFMTQFLNDGSMTLQMALYMVIVCRIKSRLALLLMRNSHMIFI